MKEPKVIHSTFVIERSFSKTPEQVFSALADAVKKRRWFGEDESHDVEEFEMEFHVGGTERARYRMKEGTPLPGAVINYQGVIQDIVPNERVVTASTMSFHEKPFSASLVTMELLPTARGTDLICTHQGSFFEGSDGPKMREAGWRHLLDKLEKSLAG